jgi:hypothetical protein
MKTAASGSSPGSSKSEQQTPGAQSTGVEIPEECMRAAFMSRPHSLSSLDPFHSGADFWCNAAPPCRVLVREIHSPPATPPGFSGKTGLAQLVLFTKGNFYS